MSPNNNSPRPIFTLRTSELAGRSAELAKLQRALQNLQTTSDKTLCFYIAGDGGMGKTRILQWVLTQYKFPAKTFHTQILDFYNSILRTDIDLVEHIYDDISSDLKAVSDQSLTTGFEEYRILRERFRTQQLGAADGDTGVRVINAFVEAWTPLANAGYRLVVLLDTAELLRFEDDPVRARFEALEPAASSKRWLLEMVDIDKKLPGVLFIVAGRKLESPRLYNELAERAGHGVTDPAQHIIELGGLSRSGVDEYFEKLTEALENGGYPEQALQLREEIDPDLRTALYELTGGSPIALALALQLFINGDTDDLPRLLNEQLDQLSIPIPDAQPRLQQALIKAMAEYQTFGPISIAVRYMALARKGLTSARLRELLQRVQPKQPVADLNALFDELTEQIFVKRLPDNSLVLHDKVADWTDEGLYRDDESRFSDVYRALVDIYQKEITELDRAIDALIPIADPVASIEEDENIGLDRQAVPQSDTFAREKAQELQLHRRNRRNRLIEQMAYALRGDPATGYKLYYELAEEAFNVGRMDYETQIRTDFLGWWFYEQPSASGAFRYRRQAEQAGLTEEIVNADFAVRAVQRTFSSEISARSPAERARATINLVERMLDAMRQGTFKLPPFVAILLDVYADMARGHLAENESTINTVRNAFAHHIRQLGELRKQKKTSKASAELETFLSLSAQAFAYYELGFFERNHGNYGDAIRNYTRSLLPYRELRFDINQARSLNDKAFSLAQVGDSQGAEIAVNDALRLRKKLGFSYPIGLSYNTLGIVQTLSDRPVTALRNCGYALRIFQMLNHEFGQMIAYRAISEAARRDAERLADDRLRAQRRLHQAAQWVETAVTFARAMLTSTDSRFVDILIECGSAYRDLARFYWQNPDLYTRLPKEPASQSKELLEEAVASARQIFGANHQLVDAMIDLAYLQYYHFFAAQTNNDKEEILSSATQLLSTTLEEIPQPYRDLHHPTHKALSASLTVYWAHLSKAHGLFVTIEQQRIRQLQLLNTPTSERQQHEDTLLREAILTLYFRSLLESNARNVRRSNQFVYEAMQTFSANTLERFYRQANRVSKSCGLPKNKQSLMKDYLTDNFGLGA